MSLRIQLSVLAAFVLAMSSAVSAVAQAADPILVGTVKRVVDGDTIRFIPDGATKDLNIRLIGIDAPESHYPMPQGGVAGQGGWGTVSGEVLKSLIPVGTKIQIQDFGTDKYGRTLGRIFFDSHDVNLEMVATGNAVPYFFCAGAECNAGYFTHYTTQRYADACEAARKAGRGIFRTTGTGPLKEMPYDFRRRISGHEATSLVGDMETHRLYQAKDQELVPVCQRLFFLNANDAHRVGFY